MKHEKTLLFLSASVAALVLAGCNEDSDKEYGSAVDCKTDQRGDCAQVYNPVKMTVKNAPRFSSKMECENKFGLGNCTEPEGGKVNRIFDDLDSCEVVYGEGTCLLKTFPIAEDNGRGQIRTNGYVYSGPMNFVDQDEKQAQTAVPAGENQQRTAQARPVFYPIVTPYSYFYPYTYGYYGGGPMGGLHNPPPRVGGSYFVNQSRASVTPGTTTRFTGSTTSPTTAKAGPSAPSSTSKAPSRAGSISPSSSGASRGGGIGSTGRGSGS